MQASVWIPYNQQKAYRSTNGIYITSVNRFDRLIIADEKWVDYEVIGFFPNYLLRNTSTPGLHLKKKTYLRV